MSKNDCDWSTYSSVLSVKAVRNIPSRKLERRFWRFYDDVSSKFLTVLRYTICLPFFYKFPDNNFKVATPNHKKHYDYGDSVRSKRCTETIQYKPKYDEELYDLKRPSSTFPDTPRSVSNCSVATPEIVKHKSPQNRRKRQPEKPRPLIRKIFNRRRKRQTQIDNGNLRDNVVFVKNRGPSQHKRCSSIKFIDDYSVTSSIEDLPNVYNDFGDGPQNKERLRRITDFFNDIYIEQHKLLMKK